MSAEDIINQLTSIFRDVMDNDDIILNPTTTANDVEEWDSLNHVQMVVAVERHFKVKFTTQEIQNWKNVGEIIGSIQNKLGTS